MDRKIYENLELSVRINGDLLKFIYIYIAFA